MAFYLSGCEWRRDYGMQVLRRSFSWKVKPKLPQQFKAAEVNGVPFAVILGDDELAEGKCKIKEMGLEEGPPGEGWGFD